MMYVFLDVLLEKLNKDLDAALLADPQKRVILTTIPQSRVLSKRGIIINYQKLQCNNRGTGEGTRLADHRNNLFDTKIRRQQGS